MPALCAKDRRGLTLIELLVVVAILLILVTVSTSMMNVAADGRDLREAARQLNAMIAGCVARAAETGRPYGVWIERTAGSPNVAREVFYAQAPPVYAGDALNSAATFPSAGATTVNLTAASQMSTAGFVQAGDSIRFNYTGPWYPITASSGTSVTFSTADKPVPVYAANASVPFQIRRGPRKSLASPLQMPGDTIIDLSQSGAANEGKEFASGTDAVRIMFSPSGTVDRAYFNNTSAPVLGTIHLLVGRLVPVAPITSNIADPAARWVSINHQTGTVITTENMPGATLADNRQFAIQGKGMQGN